MLLDNNHTAKVIKDRSGKYQDNFIEEITRILSEIVNYFDLDNSIDISKNDAQVARNLWTKVTNSVYITLFDKSDEALINDTES